MPKAIMSTLLVVMLLMFQSNPSKAEPVTLVPDALVPAAPGSVQLEGWLGERLDACAAHRLFELDHAKYLTVHQKHNDHTNWRGEYWGKWVTAAVLAHQHRSRQDHRRQIETSTQELMKAQDPDGYIGPYKPEEHLTHWDVWCRKYVLLGLITVYDMIGDDAILKSAIRQADNIIEGFAKTKRKVVEIATEVLQGTADSSIIEPMALLYQRTGDKRYIEFIHTIFAQWKEPFRWAPEGTPMLDKALAGEPPIDNHAYGIMSCFEGICELYRATGEKQYLDAVVRFGQSVQKYERMINGSVSNSERFFDGVRKQTELLEQPQETCATVTWMKLCNQLLRLTGDPVWADEMEISLYNAMVGAMTPGGEWFSYFTALNGERVPSFVPHDDLMMSCCVASGPRGLMLTPRWAVMSGKHGPVVNLYSAGTARTALSDGTSVTITQDTDYPTTDLITLKVDLAQPRRFPLSLRIPAWSTSTTLTVNGQDAPWEAGKYAVLEREWAPGDQVQLKLDFRGRANPAPSGAPQFAIMRGPVVLALDNRINSTSDTLFHLKPDSSGHVELKPMESHPKEMRMAFEVPFQVRPSHFFNHAFVNLGMCDLASAGNAWSEKNLYRVWLPQPLYLSHAFTTNTWKLMPGEGRPPIPAITQKP